MNENEKVVERMIKDKIVRRQTTRNSLFWFTHVFLGHYLEYSLADFQEEMIYLAEEVKYTTVAIMAFRNSGKSTIMNLAYPLWAVLGKEQKKCVVIISNTQEQAKIHFSNIKHELESNELLKNDLGPFRAEETVWGAYTLELEHLQAKIISVSRGQSIRGIRHKEHRPDLIICDDLEDTSPQNSVEKQNLHQWYMGEVVPSGMDSTKFIVLGNLTGEDSLLLSIRESIVTKSIKGGIFRAYPILDTKDKCLWPQKYSKKSDITELSRKFSDEAWKREYLLKIVPSPLIIFDYWGGPDREQNKDSALLPRQKSIIEKMKRYHIRSPYISHCGFVFKKKSKETSL